MLCSSTLPSGEECLQLFRVVIAVVHFRFYPAPSSGGKLGGSAGIITGTQGVKMILEIRFVSSVYQNRCKGNFIIAKITYESPEQ